MVILILVSMESDAISVTGHANYAEHGKDIVCAAVSTLTQNLIQSILDLTDDHIDCEISQGNIDIHYGNLSEESKLLVDSFFVGIAMIANEYPAYVRIV